jgi:hypothetical protein
MTLHKGENPYIYGFHDSGGEHLLVENGVPKGWVLVTEAIGANPNQQGGGNYTGLAQQGVGVIVRLNQDYGPNGTIPREEFYANFAQRCANFVAGSQGANIWLIGNEMNFEREQPRKAGSNEAEPITPRRYAKCYKLVRQKIKSVPGHQDDLVVVGAIGPWNGQTPMRPTRRPVPSQQNPRRAGDYPYRGFFGDYIRYLTDILTAIGPANCDAIAIHAYSHGYAPNLVFDQGKMGPPFQNYFYHFFTYRDQMNAIPKNMRHLPVYLTEMNGDREPNGDTWPFGNNGWIKNAYKELDAWNKSGQQQIRCGILFRWIKDPHGWSIDGKPEVQKDLKEAMQKNYQWDQNADKPAPPPVPRPEVPGYRARYLQHNTPTTLESGKDYLVNLTLFNAGGFTWVKDGANPFRLGFLWYNAAGQAVSLPQQFDYRASLPQNVRPNEQVRLQAKLRPPDAPGVYQLRWDMVHEMVTWFTSQGDAGLLVSPVTVQQPVVVAPPPQPEVKPSPPIGVAEHVQIQNISSELPQHPSKRYVERPLQAVKRIIIHHTATPASVTVQRIAEFQVKDKDLPGITYHFCTTEPGQAYQTEPLTTTAAHAGQNSRDSVGVCLIGNFMETPPPEAQLNATASVLAQLMSTLAIPVEQIFGYSDIINTQSPGATWPQWKPTLLAKAQALLSTPTPCRINPPPPPPRVNRWSSTCSSGTKAPATGPNGICAGPCPTLTALPPPSASLWRRPGAPNMCPLSAGRGECPLPPRRFCAGPAARSNGLPGPMKPKPAKCWKQWPPKASGTRIRNNAGSTFLTFPGNKQTLKI